MEYKSIQSYKNALYTSPPNEKSAIAKEKNKEWYLGNCRALLNNYLHGKLHTGYGSAELKKLRAYADGTQGNKDAKRKLLREQKDGSFKGRMKDVFETVDILPEMLDIIMTINQKATYDISAIAIDDVAINDKDLEKSLMKMMAQEETQNWLNAMGLKIDNQFSQEDIAGLNDADIDMLYEIGGAQLVREMECIAVCNKSKLESVHKFIEDYATKDAVDYGIAGTKVYIDYASSCVKYRNVDMSNVLLPQSKFRDFRDIKRCGEIVFMSLVEIIEKIPEPTIELMDKIIKGCMQYNKGYEYSLVAEHGQSWLNYENSIFDDFKVPVLDAQWLSPDHEKYLEHKHTTGGLVRRAVKDDYKLSRDEKSRDSKIDRKKFIKKYECLWLIGTDILLSHDEAKNNVYYGPTKNRIPKIDYSFVKTGKPSLVKRCITFVNDINLAETKLRSAIATIPPGPRMVIYEHALRNVSFGGVRQSREDLLSALAETGYLIVSSTDEKGNINTANGGKVVDFIPSGIMEDLTIFENYIQTRINRIRQVIGLPEGLDGTAGNPYQGLGKQEIAAAASSNALYPTLSIVGPLFERTFELCVFKWQSLARGKEGIRVQDLGINEHTVKVFELSKDFSNSDFNLKMTFAPTEEERNALMVQIGEMSIAYTQSNGMIGCNKSEYFLLERLIRAGRLDDARVRIARIEKQRDILNIKREQANIQANAEVQENAAIVAQEQARETAKIKGDEDRKTALTSKIMEGVTDVSNEYVKSQSTEVKTIGMADVQNALNVIMMAAEQLAPQQEQAPVADESMMAPENNLSGQPEIIEQA